MSRRIHSLDAINTNVLLIPVALPDADVTLLKGDGKLFSITPTATRVITLPTEDILEGEPIEIRNLATAQDVTVESSDGDDIATYRNGKREFVSLQDIPTDETHWQVAAASQLVGDNGVSLKVKVIDIGDWDMDTVSSITVAHNLGSVVAPSLVRSISALIRNDSDTIYFALPTTVAGGISAGSEHIEVNDTNIVLARGTGGLFDSEVFASTSYNSVWVTIWYEG